MSTVRRLSESGVRVRVTLRRPSRRFTPVDVYPGPLNVFVLLTPSMGSGMSNSRRRGPKDPRTRASRILLTAPQGLPDAHVTVKYQSPKDGQNAHQKKAAPASGLPQPLVLSKFLSFLTQTSKNTKETASEPAETHDQGAGSPRRARRGVSLCPHCVLVDLCLLPIRYCYCSVAVVTYGHHSVTDKKLESVLATAHFRMCAAEKRKRCT